jgi:hypothetical protein
VTGTGGLYEEQLALVEGLPHAKSDSDREIGWGNSGGSVGLARTSVGRIEIFLPGPALKATLRRVREALEHQRWFRADGGALEANRILLPEAGHFEQIAAFLSTELLRNGAATDLSAAFAKTEPLIEMAIEELLLADDAFRGLCGEMRLLLALMREASDDRVTDVLTSWKGHRETARDFQLGLAGVEVKTTTRSTSSHLFRGVHQLERGHGVNGAEETTYLLVSMGMTWVNAHEQDENTTSLPKLVDDTISRLRATMGPAAEGASADFLAHVADYGAPGTVGYDHATMREHQRFRRRFRLAFARGYDIADPQMRLLTTDDLVQRPFIQPDSLHMRVRFPDQVTGDVNPVHGLRKCAQRILTAAWS